MFVSTQKITTGFVALPTPYSNLLIGFVFKLLRFKGMNGDQILRGFRTKCSGTEVTVAARR